jgi:phosphatidylinositol kinase/protein kinase (PI-3  family)
MTQVGDDLRQDSLILQLLRVMEDLWRREGLEMRMMIYDCISTGFERGLLQVVQNATTLGSVILESTLGKLSIPEEDEAATGSAEGDGTGKSGAENRKSMSRKSTSSASQSGTLSLKLRSAAKALGGHGVLREWLMHQVYSELPASDPAARAQEMERYVSWVVLARQRSVS